MPELVNCPINYQTINQFFNEGRKSRPVSANRVPENVQFAEIKVKQSGRDLPGSNMEELKGKLNNDMFGTYQ